MDYKPVVAVWELTMNCNMRCKHCGSGCEGPTPDELTPEEALHLCDALGKIGLKHITLSGGEPFTRKDWPLIAQRLISHGITTAVITNGWLLDEATVEKAAEVGICGFGISIDGTPATHDYIRKAGSFERIEKAIDLIKSKNIPITAVTCIHGKNLNELPLMKELFTAKGINAWQLQAADPMGNLLDHLEWILDPSEIDTILDFAHATMLENKIKIDIADNIGYYNVKDLEIRRLHTSERGGIWHGCGAGKQVIGIRCNGDIIGCLSIRDDKFIEGNIRQMPLEEIWSRPGAFAWNRTLTKKQLTDFCGKCQYGAYCLAGCGGMKITRFKSTTENGFCSYRCAAETERAAIEQLSSFDEVMAKGRACLAERDFQVAEMALLKAHEMRPKDAEVLNLLGFASYSVENYEDCLASNQKALALDPNNAYAHKGMGVCLDALGQTEASIASLKRAVELADESFLDPCYDLAVVYCKHGRRQEALSLLEQARARSSTFVSLSESFYRRLVEENTLVGLNNQV